MVVAAAGGWYFWVSNPKLNPTGYSLTVVPLNQHPCLFITFIKLKLQIKEREWKEKKEKHPESRRRRSPKDRRDFDLVSVDNQPVTSTGPRGRQGPWLQSAHSQCCGIWCRGREVKKISLKPPTFLYLSSGERRDGCTGSIKMVIRWGKLPTLQLSRSEA